MSNQIFCEIDKPLCDIVKRIAGDRIVVDCGAGRGLFGSMYDGKVISIDIEEPEEPLSKIVNCKAEHFCFPIDSVPIFIRPCHSMFTHEVILCNEEKINTAIYVGLEENLEIDFNLDSKRYSIEKYNDIEWVGKSGEFVWVIRVNRTSNETFKQLNGKILYVSDPMLSYFVENQHQEFHEIVENPLLNRNILVNGKRLRLHEWYPQGENFDYMFFDWGGMSVGNNIMETYCRLIAKEAKDYPSRIWIVVSTFTSYAMEEAIEEFGNENHNIFTSIDDFASYFNNQN